MQLIQYSRGMLHHIDIIKINANHFSVVVSAFIPLLANDMAKQASGTHQLQ
jgi:hypothetical protein